MADTPAGPSADELYNVAAQKRRVLQELIQPQLDAIILACSEVEKKVGMNVSLEREAAIQLVTTTALGVFHNIPCGIVGWCEVGGGRDDVAFYAVSYAHHLFLTRDADLFLSACMKNITDRIGVEQFELMELVQNRRAVLGETK